MTADGVGRYPEGADIGLSMNFEALSDDQRHGLACIGCGCSSGGPTRHVPTPGNPDAAAVIVHAELLDCVRNVSRYVDALHMRLVDDAQDMHDNLISLDDARPR